MARSCMTLMLLLAAAAAIRPSEMGEAARTGFACEDSTLTIDCGDQGDKRIFVVRANYGRQNIGICNDGGDTSGWNLQCISTRAAGRVAQMCNGQVKCEIQASNRHFGDSCYLTPKYLEVQFKCQVPKPEPTEASTTPHPPPPPTTTTTATTTTTSLPNVELTTPRARTTTTTTRPKPTRTPRPTLKPQPPTKPPTPKPGPSTKVPPPPLHHTTTERMIGDQGRPITHCEEKMVRGVFWPRTTKGAWAKRPCPNNPAVSKAFWQCGRDYHADWIGKPNLSGCKSRQLEDLGNKLAMAQQEFSTEIVTEVASELQQASANQDLFGGDIKAMSMIMKDMVQQVDVQAKNESKPISKRFVQNVTEAVLNTSSNMLAAEKEDSWTDLPQSLQAETATRVVSTVEESAYQLADTYREPTVVVNITLNIMLEVNVVDTRGDDVQDVTFPQMTLGPKPSCSDWMGGGNSIKLSGNSLKELSTDGLARVIFLTYNNLEKWLRPPPVTRDLPETRPDNYEEFRAREPEVFDPNEIEFESMNPGRDQSDNTLRNDLARGRGDLEPNVIEQPEVRTEAAVATTTIPPPTTQEAPSGGEKNKTTRKVNSQVISASVMQKTKDPKTGKSDMKGHVPLSEPVLYTLEHKTTNNVYNPTCSFWEYSEKTFQGRWSNFGCRVKETNVTHTTCACNHVTNFAVLMDVQAQELTDGHEFALSFITYLGCILSAVCLLLAFLTFAVFKNLQCDRNTIHKNLVLCLLIAEVLFLAGIMQHTKPILCTVVAAFLHYFFLAAFMWMLMEGVQLYVMLVEVFESEKSRVKYYYLMAYGTPAIVVGVSAAVDHTGYGTDSHCWLEAEGGFIWAFVGPVIAIITINIVMLSIAIYQMCKHADAAAGWKMKQKSKMENVRSWVKGASVLVVLLGLTWTFGLLYINQHTVFMAYIFTILNSLQGLFIFIFHCAMNEKIQKEYKRCIRHATWLPESIRVKYGDAKPYASTSPNQSSSSGNYLTRLISGRRRKRSSTTTIRSSLSNPSKSGQYQNAKSDKNSALESGHMTDSGIGRHPDSICNDTTEDQGGYLEPISIRVNDHLLDDMEAGAEFSMMEGSCVDTDCYGVEAYNKPAKLDIDKYKIKSPSGRLSAISNDRPTSESDFSDAELLRMAEKEKMMNDYEELLSENSDPETEEPRGSYDTMLQKKLKQFENDKVENIPTSCMNNLNKGDNEAYRDSLLLSEPNIMGREETLKRHLPTYKDNNVCGDTLDKLTKVTPHSAKYVVNPPQEKTAHAGNRNQLSSSHC